MRPESGFRIAPNGKNDNDVPICRHDVIIIFFDVAMFCLSSLVIGLSFMSISLLVLRL